jgi:hypothetical protein
MSAKEGTYIGKREFETFKAECRKWVKRFGLTDWKLAFHFEKVDRGLAGINHDYEGKIARVSLNPFQENCKRRDVDVRRSARHEILHLLLGELHYLNGKRIVSDNMWEAAEHGVIRRLEAAFDE